MINLQGRKSPGGPKHRCGDSIKMDFREKRHENVDYIHQAQDRDQWYPPFVNRAMKLQVP
jgi:hypothetical protein